MSQCRKVEGLVAASLYEPLNPRDAELVDRHLAACDACRHEFDSLRALVSAIPSEQPEFAGDLLPALREEIRRSPGRARVFGWWGFGAAMAAAALLAALVGYTVQAPEMPLAEYATVQPASPMLEALALASEQIDQANFNGAYQVLNKALQTYPDDAMAGDAQMLMADLAYSELYRYEDAFNAYETLRTQHYETFTSAPEIKQRWELLAEAQGVQFASLEALEAARRAGRNGFEQLEHIIGRYPTQMVASLAADEMGRMMAEEIAENGGIPDDVLAMERARERCSDPVAIARLDLELAEVYMTERQDGAQACTLFQRVLESGDPALAQLAQDAVARLGADCGA